MPPRIIRHDGYPVDFSSYDLEYDDPDGLIAVGANFYPETLLSAYTSGLFPWFVQDDMPFWFCPDPRMVLFVDQLKISKSMLQVVNSRIFDYSCDQAFDQVIAQCAQVKRKGHQDTWIDDHFIEGYTEMHRLGHAHSFEAWQDNELVGGLYGLAIGKVFFGESMFTKKNNASKAAFLSAIRYLSLNGFEMVDCQVYTDHLASLGAITIERSHFLDLLDDYLVPSVMDGISWHDYFEKQRSR